MIEFQINALIKAKGFKSPYRNLVDAGISYNTARGYITGKRTKINLEHIEILCTLLRCRPDQLFSWTPSQPTDDYPDHPLQPIKKKKLLNVDETLKKLSVDEIEKRLGGV